MNVNRTRDTTILGHSARARPMLDALLADPVLGPLHEQACDWHTAKIAELKERPGWDEFLTWLKNNMSETTGEIENRDY
jgi:hypothetical protein